MTSIKFIWQKYAPLYIQNTLKLYSDTALNKNRRKMVISQYKNNKTKNQPKEIHDAIKFLRKHSFTPFPYDWSLKYDTFISEIFFDSKLSFHYMIFEGKKLYFPKKYSRNQVLWTMRGVLKEQDVNSAHLYLTDKFQIENDSILIDGGVAEGSFSLSAIEKVKKLYLIECNPDWIEALELTFSPWKDKVVILGKYLSDKVSENTISIDSIMDVNETEKYFVKLDVEGYEIRALQGMNSVFSKAKNLKMCVCTYHHLNDAYDINKYLSYNGLKCDFSDSFLIFIDNNEMPSFRKALIRAEK